MRAFAPAKINLHLHVLGRRGDGYHLLDSLVVFALAGDEIEFAPAHELKLSIEGPERGALIAEPDNLVLRAAHLLARETGITAHGRLTLYKNLPVASGIGGGSADAAASLREGLEEMFTVNRLGLSPSLMWCLGSTNLIESPHSGVRLRKRKICRWRDGAMVLRWGASAFLITEKNFRKIQGYRDLWMLKAVLNSTIEENQASSMEQAA